LNLLDLTFSTPAENLACDEALLEAHEANGGAGVLRFWEPRSGFVVVGYANHAGTEVNLAACRADGVPVLRRCSGGGTVLQGPGCLNYSLILKISEDGPLNGIPSANRFIMERNRATLADLLQPCSSRREEAPISSQPGQSLLTSAATVSIEGHTDLAMGGRKFSGNAQRRRKNFLLFHGTFLLGFDLSLIGKYLAMPSRQPDYRRDRAHEEFLTNVPVAADAVKRALSEAWQARAPLEIVPHETIASLARNKYATADWNLKF